LGITEPNSLLTLVWDIVGIHSSVDQRAAEYVEQISRQSAWCGREEIEPLAERLTASRRSYQVISASGAGASAAGRHVRDGKSPRCPIVRVS
jgi:hypothetical protein